MTLFNDFCRRITLVLHDQFTFQSLLLRTLSLQLRHSLVRSLLTAIHALQLKAAALNPQLSRLTQLLHTQHWDILTLSLMLLDYKLRTEQQTKADQQMQQLVLGGLLAGCKACLGKELSVQLCGQLLQGTFNQNLTARNILSSYNNFIQGESFTLIRFKEEHPLLWLRELVDSCNQPCELLFQRLREQTWRALALDCLEPGRSYLYSLLGVVMHHMNIEDSSPLQQGNSVLVQMQRRLPLVSVCRQKYSFFCQ